MHVCAYPHVSMQVCDVSVCVCTGRGESTTRDLRSHATLPTSGSRLQSCSQQMGSQRRQTSSKPAGREIIMLDAGLKPSLSFFSPVKQIVLPPQPQVLTAQVQIMQQRVDSHAVQKRRPEVCLCFHHCLHFFAHSFYVI